MKNFYAIFSIIFAFLTVILVCKGKLEFAFLAINTALNCSILEKITKE